MRGSERRDVRTTLLSVQPRYDYRDGQAPKLTGYELANVVEVTVRDLDRVGDVVDGALGAGATSMDGLSFRVADPAPAEREARIRAMAAAPRASADVLAEAAGLAIVWACRRCASKVTRRRPPTPRYKAERMALAAADVGTPVETGSMEIAVTRDVRAADGCRDRGRGRRALGQGQPPVDDDAQQLAAATGRSRTARRPRPPRWR